MTPIPSAPVLEVVIPAFNAAAFLRETLESLAAQTRPADLVTIVDDRSTDGTRTVAEMCRSAFAGRLPIRVLANAGPRGPASARNTAIRQSTAELIALMDSDDLAEPGHHRALLDLIGRAEDIVLAFGNSLVFGADGILVPDMHVKSGLDALPAQDLPPDGHTLGERMFDALLGAGIFTTSAVLFRRTAALEAGLFDETLRYSEDTDLFLRMTLTGRFAFTRAVVTRKRVHGSNLMGHSKLHFCRGTALALSRLSARVADGMPPFDRLSPGRRSALAAALRREMYGWLYAASWEGISAYREAAEAARAAGLGRMALDPKHLARLLIARMWRPAQR